MTEVIMPKMGDAMEEGTLVEWLKREGEKVKSGEVIGTIQTDNQVIGRSIHKYINYWVEDDVLLSRKA